MLTWEGDRPIEIYFNSSIRRARDMLSDPAARGAYLEEIARRLDTTVARQRALECCQAMAEVDGDLAAAEVDLLEQIRSSFGLEQG